MNNWLRSWCETFIISLFEPDLYRDLTRAFDLAEFEAVDRPEDDRGDPRTV